MHYQLTILENPNGTFSFVGSVPLTLAFDSEDESEIERQLRLPSSYRTMKTRTFKTRQDAEMALVLLKQKEV